MSEINKKKRSTNLGETQKAYEDVKAKEAILPGIPVIARLDGKAFHTYTKGLGRPFDANLSKCMLETTKFLCEKFHPTVAYTQSDEITLMWENSDVGFQFPYKGRYQKLVSILAATASAQFTLLANDLLPSKKGVPVIFDARVWQVPNIDEAYSNFLWRQDDAIKNAVSMAAQAVYSHKELHKKNTDQKLIMLAEKDVHFGSYPEHFKSGAFVKRVSRKCKLTPLELDLIPEAHRNPDTLVERSAYEFFSLTKFNTEASLRKLHAGYFKILFLDKVFNES